jgi:hypothetical protein
MFGVNAFNRTDGIAFGRTLVAEPAKDAPAVLKRVYFIVDD